MKRKASNPAGREGKPISLYPHSFDEVVRKMLATPPPKADLKPERKTPKKATKKR
jgi:hypothetical protein